MTVLRLLRPRWLGMMPKSGDIRGRMRIAAIGLLGIGFIVCGHWITMKVLRHFHQAQDIGTLLAYKLLSILMITCFSLLLFSSILSALTKLFLSRDLELVHSLPVSSESVFHTKWVESVFDASWMVVVFAVPILVAYGRVFHAGVMFYGWMMVHLIGLCVAAAAVAVLFVVVAVLFLPASRLHNLVLFLGIAAFVGLYVAFRLARPERLADPETFPSVLIYVEHLRAADAAFLPSTWCSDGLKAALTGRTAVGLIESGKLWSFSVFLMGLGRIIARRFYFVGYSKSQTASVSSFRISGGADWFYRTFSRPNSWRGIFVKEWRCFFRDPSQWSQLLLIAALVVVYIYNYTALPLHKVPVRTEYLQNLLAFLNMALAGFVLTALSGRFAYPAVSAEGKAFWIMRSAPICIRRWLWMKFWMILIPFWVLGMVLVVSCNWKLGAGAWMMGLSVFTMTVVTPAILGLGLGLGAAFADFTIENANQAVTGFGGMVFMIASVCLIGLVLVMEAGPVHRYLVSELYKHRQLTVWNWIWFGGTIGAVAGICIGTLVAAMRYGERKLLG